MSREKRIALRIAVMAIVFSLFVTFPATGQDDVQMCREAGVFPDPCDRAMPYTYVPGCPLRRIDELDVENDTARGSGKVARATLAVAMKEFEHLTNESYHRYTCQVAPEIDNPEDCRQFARGLWKWDRCLIQAVVRDGKLGRKECKAQGYWWESATSKQEPGPGAGCQVPAQVIHGETARLRTYGLGPYDDDVSQNCLRKGIDCFDNKDFDFGFPGTAIVLRKGCAPGQLTLAGNCNTRLRVDPRSTLPNNGDRLELVLYNALEPDETPDNKCNDYKKYFDDLPPITDPHDEFPDCFHGDDVTNLHFHGSHVSPQDGQDFVVVAVRPVGEKEAESHDTGHGPASYAVTGKYNINLDPITWRQAEGTHWYHPHKHGSTALQVLNGMAGPFIVKGPFDDFIETEVFGAENLSKYRNKLHPNDKILVVQAISDDLNFPGRFPLWNSPWLMINGQLQPVITIKLGEVQRWRFIGGTQNAAAHINFSVGGEIEIIQIAQDGVQFSPSNYPNENNPLLAIDVTDDAPEAWDLAAGNRIDFLVKGTKGGRHVFNYSPVKKPHENARVHVGDPAQKYPLFYVDVIEDGGKDMEFPQSLPTLPHYLRDVEDDEIVRHRTVYFSTSQLPAGAGAVQDHFEPRPIAKFYIDGKLYDPSCVDQTMVLGTAEEWKVVNNSSATAHPLHIHTNPFQVTAMKFARAKSNNRYERVEIDFRASGYAPVWRDTIALPTAVEVGGCQDGSGNPVDLPPALCTGEDLYPPVWTSGERIPYGSVFNGEITIRHRFEDFSGPYVLHCHILGHEDRGMMQDLQTICPNGMWANPANYFKYDPDAPPVYESGTFPPRRSPECRPHNYEPALESCSGVLLESPGPVW